ncbi:MAG: ester cyclase [Bacteroidota bacterium]
MKSAHEIGRQLYKGFAENNLSLWDDIIDDQVEIRSTVGEMPMRGKAMLLGWAQQFLHGFSPTIDLVDEFDNGQDRAIIAVNLHWQHIHPFFDYAPTGASGTSIEYFNLTIKDGKIVRFWVIDHTFDLALYLVNELKMPYPTLFKPEAIIKGAPLNRVASS